MKKQKILVETPTLQELLKQLETELKKEIQTLDLQTVT